MFCVYLLHGGFFQAPILVYHVGSAFRKGKKQKLSLGRVNVVELRKVFKTPPSANV